VAALELLRRMDEMLLQPDAISLNAAISSCSQGQRWAAAVHLLSEMPKKKVSPDVVSYNATMNAAKEANLWPLSLQLLDEVHVLRIQPNLISFNTVLAACVRPGRWSSASRILQSMKDCSFGPDRRSWTSLVAAFARGSKWMEAYNTMQELRQMRLEADLVAFGASASACQRGHQWILALELFSEVKSANLKPDEPFCASVVTACAMGLQWEVAMSLLQSMPRRQLNATSTSSAPVLTALLETKQWERALQLFLDMPRPVADAQIYSQMIMVCEQYKLRHLHRQLLESAVNDLAGSTPGYTSLVAALALLNGTQPLPRLSPTATAKLSAAGPWRAYAKEIRLMEHVLETATEGDPESVCNAIETFGLKIAGSKGWLKVAAGDKAKVLVTAARSASNLLLEIGTYCGQSAIRLAATRRAKVVTLELDPIHAIIARTLVAFAGLSAYIEAFDFVFMDQRGSRYEEDLATLERLELLNAEAVIVADNVLKPGAPRFLWRLCKSSDFETEVVRVNEFAMPVEDWMSVSFRRGKLGKSPNTPTLPNELGELSQAADEMRNRAQTAGGVSFREWSTFAEMMRERLHHHGIAATSDVQSLPRLERKTCCMGS
ncbi:unnamed protein product, partial [Cladocopium goreaui]